MVDLGLEFLDQKGGVVCETAVLRRFGRGLLGFAFFGAGGGKRPAIFVVTPTTVVHRHHDDFLNFFFSDEDISGGVQFPTTPTEATIGSRGTEDVLTIVQIENRIT